MSLNPLNVQNKSLNIFIEEKSCYRLCMEISLTL